MILSRIWNQDPVPNRVTTAERLNLGLNLNQKHKYLEVYDVTLDQRFTWDGTTWVLTEVVASGDMSVTVEFVAQVNISSFQVVTSDGFVGDSAVIGQRSKIVGIALNNVLTGFTGTAVIAGKITNSGWAWTIGDILYLNGTSISTVAPASVVTMTVDVEWTEE